MSIDTIWYTRCPVPTAFSVAVRLGWLDEEFGRDGIAFRSLATSRDHEVRQSHFEHTQANSIRHGGVIPPLVTRSRGNDLRIVGLSVSWARQQILARPGSGIRSPADLKGKRLSIPRRVNDSIDFFRATVLRGFDLLLKQEGLSWNDVVPVDLPVGRSFVEGMGAGTGKSDSLFDARSALSFRREEVQAVLRGEVDAVFAYGANGVFVQAYTGSQVIAELERTDNPSDWVNNQPYPLTVSGSLADGRHDLAGRLVHQVQRAAAWARDNERETKRIIAAETGLPEELIDHAYGPKVHLELDIDLSPKRLAALKTLHDHLDANGFLAEPVDLEAFLNRRALAVAGELPIQPAVQAAAAE